jgi:hypothetical protein
MIELDQAPRRIRTIETTETIEGTEAPREDEMGMHVADYRFTQLPITHHDRTTEMKAGLNPSTGKSEFPTGFLTLQYIIYLSGCPTSSSLLIIPSIMARKSRISGSTSIPSQLS